MEIFWVAVGSIGACVAAVAAGLAAWFTYNIMQSGQEQVRVSQAQVIQALGAQQDALLPLLMPTVPLEELDHPHMDTSGKRIWQGSQGYSTEKPYTRVAVKNVGPGIALNMRGVIYPATPERSGDVLPGHIHSYVFPMPLLAGAQSEHEWRAGGPIISGDTELRERRTERRCTLYAPQKPAPVDSTVVAEKIARLTLTYSDVFGRKHAAMYDLAKGIDSNQFNWELEAYLRDIVDDLSDLEVMQHRPPVFAPPTPSTLPPQSLPTS